MLLVTRSISSLLDIILTRSSFAATDELSHQLMCISMCHWRVYSSFSTRNSAVHRHHSR